MSNDTPRRRTSRRQFGTVRKLPSGRFQARYQDAYGQVHTGPNTFPTKTDASVWLDTVRADLERGDWLDPRLGNLTFTEWAGRWMDGNAHRSPRTREGYESILTNHVLPALGDRRVTDIQHHDVQRFVSKMSAGGAGAGTVANAYRVVKGVLDTAVLSGALKWNPSRKVKLPRADRREMSVLTADEVEAVAHAITDPPNRDGTYPDYGLLVRFAAYTGLRAAEVAGLRAGRVDLFRGTVHVVETTVAVRGGVLLERQPTKTRQGRRVVMPRFLAVLPTDVVDDLVW